MSVARFYNIDLPDIKTQSIDAVWHYLCYLYAGFGTTPDNVDTYLKVIAKGGDNWLQHYLLKRGRLIDIDGKSYHLITRSKLFDLVHGCRIVLGDHSQASLLFNVDVFNEHTFEQLFNVYYELENVIEAMTEFVVVTIEEEQEC